MVYQAPMPEPLFFIEPSRTEANKMHALEEYGPMYVKLYEDITQFGGISLAYDYPVMVNIRGLDDRHEYRVMPLLKTLFGEAVTEPIRLHVTAKRYLCAVDSRYWTSLSPASQRSLELQGGTFSAGEAQRFIQLPYAQEAVKLRTWDDLAKALQAPTPSLDDFIPILQSCLKLTAASTASINDDTSKS